MKFYFLTFTFLLLSCFNYKVNIEGEWLAKDKYYEATYEITLKNSKLQGKVISYNDGTTKFDKNNRKDWYVFENLEMRNGEFMDGYSGATSINKKTISLKQVHYDTLEVNFYFSKENFRKEKWIRKKTEL